MEGEWEAGEPSRAVTGTKAVVGDEIDRSDVLLDSNFLRPTLIYSKLSRVDCVHLKVIEVSVKIIKVLLESDGTNGSLAMVIW